MKKLLLLFTTLYFFSPFGGIKGGFCQNPLVKQWDYRFGGTSFDGLTSLIQTRDGGFILGGSSTSDSSGDKTQANRDATGNTSDYWVVKLDSLGIKQWDKTFGGTGSDELNSLKQTNDGGYILGGASLSGIGGDKTQASQGVADYWIVKLDSLGNKQWDKDFGGANYDELFSLQQTTDKGYILGGWSDSDSSGDKTQASYGFYDYWIVKIDSLGNKQWDKDFGGTDYDYFTSLQQTADEGYILGGYSYSGIGGDKTLASYGFNDYWLVKIDSLGVKQWDKDFGGSGFDFLYSLQESINGGYILAGVSQSGISGNKTTPLWGGIDWDLWIIKTDSFGNKAWEKDFGGINLEDELGNISLTSDKGYLLAGTSYSNISGDKTENNLGNEQSWIIKTDSLGNRQWDKTLHTNTLSDDEIGLAVQTRDGCYVLANCTQGGIGGDKSQPAWSGFSDYWIIKFCDTTTCYATIPTITQAGDTLFANTNYASYQWFYGSAAISGATNYFYVATQSGNYNIEATDSNGCTAGAGIINVIANLPVANGYWQSAIFPNPSTNTFTIKNISSPAPALLQIVNAVGEIVYTETLVGKSEYVIHPNLAAGFYFAEITCAEKKIVSKLVIEK